MIISELTGLPPVGLAEMEQRAALQSRTDRKYIVPTTALGPLLAKLERLVQVLDIDGLRQFGYASLYFDTPDLLGYRLTALRHRRRFKVRTRTYADSGACFVEVKTPGPRGSTVKHRTEHDHHDSIETGRPFVDSVLHGHGFGDRLGLLPVLHTEYRRCTLLLADDAGEDSRVTIDTNLRWRTTHRDLRLPRIAIVETKSVSAAGAADRHLWRHGHRPVAVSKYATGLAALQTDLPAAPWRRVLRRHFSPKEGTAHE